MNNLDSNDYNLLPHLAEEDPITLKSEEKTITRTLYLTTLISIILAASIIYFE